MPKHLKTKSENGRVTSAGRLVLLKENKCVVAGFLTGFEMAADGVQFQRTAQRRAWNSGPWNLGAPSIKIKETNQHVDAFLLDGNHFLRGCSCLSLSGEFLSEDE